MTRRHCLRAYPARGALAGAAILLATAGCGERHTRSPGGDSPGSATTSAGAGRVAMPALARAPRAPEEIVVSGQGAPRAHGPFAFHGRYRVRFEQLDPEDPAQTFTTQTSFVVFAARAPDQDQGPGTIRLVRRAARTGSAIVRLQGRLWINVSFGDFPYAVRLTPLPRAR